MLNKELCRLFNVDSEVENIVNKMEEIEDELIIIYKAKSRLRGKYKKVMNKYYEEIIIKKKKEYGRLKLIRDSYCDIFHPGLIAALNLLEK